jgi:hypothetical protein
MPPSAVLIPDNRSLSRGSTLGDIVTSFETDLTARDRTTLLLAPAVHTVRAVIQVRFAQGTCAEVLVCIFTKNISFNQNKRADLAATVEILP